MVPVTTRMKITVTRDDGEPLIIEGVSSVSVEHGDADTGLALYPSYLPGSIFLEHLHGDDAAGLTAEWYGGEASRIESITVTPIVTDED